MLLLAGEGEIIKHTCIYIHLYKRKQKKDKLETNKTAYPQGLVGNELDRITGMGRGWKSSDYNFVLWNHVNVLHIKQ